MRIAAVLFDLDGVLVESEHLWEEAWSGFSALHDVAWDDDDTRRAQGMSVPEWSAAVADHVGLPADRRGEVAEWCVSHVVERASHGDDVPLLEGATELLEAASSIAPCALASSAARRVIDAVLRRHGLVHRFEATVSSEEVRRGKPFPDVYVEAARRLGAPPRDCVAFEDSSNGLRAAHACGATVIALPNPHYPPAPEALALAHTVATDHLDAARVLVHDLALEEIR